MQFAIPAFITELLAAFPDANIFVVGGAVRDAMLERKTNDLDFVVTGVSRDALETFLSARGEVDKAGKHYGVYKFQGFDVALPRTERAGGSGGYHDVEVESDPNLPIEKDLARRDFTMNAMAWDLRNKKLIDPFGGAEDVKKKLIRTVGDPRIRFAEDLSRVTRALRFAETLGFTIDTETEKAVKEAGLAHGDKKAS